MEEFMQRSFHYGVIAVALLAGTSLALAQQSKTQQNSADEALTKSAPEAKDGPQAPAPMKIPDQASQPGLQQEGQVFTDGKLSVQGASQGTQDEPAKFSAKNDKIDHLPIMAYPLSLTDEQKRAIYQRLSQGQGPVSNITAKPSEQVPATLALQELPQDMAASMPSVRDYKFLRTADKILVVNPRESIVVGEITN
jgi:hypothetical protein